MNLIPTSSRAGPAAALTLLFAASCLASAQTEPTIIESVGEASVEMPPDEIGFRLERSFSAPTLIDAMKQVRAFERSVSQGIDDLEITVNRQDAARVLVRQRAIRIEASLVLWIAATPGSPATTQSDLFVEAAERARKLAVSVSADVAFAGCAITERETVEQEAVARAAENALYLADAAGELAQRRVVDVERVTILEVRWDGVAPPPDGSMMIPPEVSCNARVRIAYRYESGAAPQ